MKFLKALSVQKRSISALYYRELYTRFGRDNIGWAWMLAEPLMFAFAVMILYKIIRGNEHGHIDVLSFTFTGYMPILIFRHTGTQALYCVKYNVGLLFHKQVKFIDIFIARMIIEVGGVYAGFVLAGGVFIFLGIFHMPYHLDRIYLGFILMTYFSVSMALIVASLSEISEVAEKVWSPVSYIMNPLSGFFFLVSWLPAGARPWAELLPTVNAYELIRSGYYGPYMTAYLDTERGFAITTVIFFIGLVLSRKVHSHIEFG
jgi:capsular polysaccharide transport system permease protein